MFLCGDVAARVRTGRQSRARHRERDDLSRAAFLGRRTEMLINIFGYIRRG